MATNARDVTRKAGEPHDHDTIREAARVFVSTGSFRKTSELTGVNRNTLVAWEHRANDVWVEACTCLQQEKSRELRHQYVAGAEAALRHTLEHLQDASPSQSAVISGVFLDKSRILDSLPTSISATTGTNAQLQSLAKQFEALAAGAREYKAIDASVVSEQAEE